MVGFLRSMTRITIYKSQNKFMSSKILVCTQCGYIGEPKGKFKGSGCLAVFLWIFFLIPGLIYTIWILSSRHKICPVCKSRNLIPADSPKGKEALSKNKSKEEIEKIVHG